MAQATPVEKRIISESPALSSKWVTKLGFIPFFPEDNDNESEVIEYLNQDLSCVLGLPFHQFWSQVLFDQSFRDFFDMYLRYARRKSVDLQWTKPQAEEVKRSNLQQQLFHRVFLVIRRLLKLQESEQDFMSLSYFLELNQKHTLFDIPKIFDLCSLYVDYNISEVQEFVQFLFQNIPTLSQELKETVPALKKVFVELRKKLHKKTIKPMDFVEVEDYLMDILHTIYVFLSVYPKGALEFSDLIQDLAFNYDVITPVLLNQDHLPKIRKKFVQVAALIFDFFCSALSDPQLTREEVKKIGSQFFGMMRALSDNRKSLRESTEGPYDPSLFGRFLNEFSTGSRIPKRLAELKKIQNITSEFNLDVIIQDFIVDDEENPFASPKPLSNNSHALDSPEMLKKIRELKEIFGSTYGDGFLALCIDHFQGNAERTVHHILEESLPQQLLKSDKKMTLNAALLVSGKGTFHTKPTGETERASIFSGTALDLQSNVAISKDTVIDKKHHKDVDMSILDDKEHIHQHRERYTDEMFDSFSFSSSSSGEEVGAESKRRRKVEVLYDDEPDDSRNEFGVHLHDSGQFFDGEFQDVPELEEDEEGSIFTSKNPNRPQIKGGDSAQNSAHHTPTRGGAPSKVGRGGRGAGGQPSKSQQQQTPKEKPSPQVGQSTSGVGRGQPSFGRGQSTKPQQQQQPQPATQANPSDGQTDQGQQGQGGRGGRGGRGGGSRGGRGPQSSSNTKNSKAKQQHDRKYRAAQKEAGRTSSKPPPSAGGAGDS